MTTNSEFDRFADAIAALPAHFSSSVPLPECLKMAEDRHLSMYYAPFDHVQHTARIVVVGITPGRQQALEAIGVARRLIHDGADTISILSKAKATASFAGPMRQNLISLLDSVGLPHRLGIRSSAELWGPRNDLVHFTSALRYPVFEENKNFGGSGLVRSRFLLGQVDSWFASEVQELSGALFLPLGAASLSACGYLLGKGIMREEQVLRGLPHPSGANAERIAYFLGRKPKDLLSAKTCAASIDTGRDLALQRVASWR